MTPVAQAYTNEGNSTGMTRSVWGPPCIIYEKIVPLLPQTASVLDLGCGDGRHSLMFARLGFQVTAVDISPVAIATLKRFAAEESLPVNAITEDICKLSVDRKFHLILAHGVLQLLPHVKARQVIRQFKNATVPGGFNVVVVITSKIAMPNSSGNIMVGLFEDGAVRKYYDDWQIVSYEAYSKAATEMAEYPRHFNRLVARRQD